MANKTIAELTAGTAPDGTELVHGVQGGNSRKFTLAQLRDLGLIDEDSFASDTATKAPSQQSTKAYIDSAIPAKLNASGSAPVFGCRAWVNFHGGTGVIRASGNVTSVTKNSTGDYTINFATNLPDANYSVGFGVVGTGVPALENPIVTIRNGTAPTASALRIEVRTEATNAANAALADIGTVCVQIFR